MDDFPVVIATSFAVTSAVISVTHHAATGIGSAPAAIVLRQPQVEPDTLSRIQVSRHAKAAKSVLLLWERHSAALEVGLFFSEPANTLFIGAGSFAAAVRLDTAEVVGAHDVFLFWSFRPCRQFVIELGELTCFLRSAAGDVLSEASVDPPYDMFETPEGVRFESPVMGTQWLRFPEEDG
jgi:hypothetical protein